MFKLRRSDMDPRESRFIVDTLNVIRERSVTADFKWSAYCSDIKTVLDSRFGGEWNVMIGKSVGFAMKSRKKSSLVAASQNGEVVVCWKSPGFEIEDSDMVKAKAQIIVDERDTLLDAGSDSKTTALNFVQQPAVDSSDYTTDTPQGTYYKSVILNFLHLVLRVLNALTTLIAEKDHQEAAKVIRTQYVRKRFSV